MAVFARDGIAIKRNHRVLRVLPSAIEVDGEGVVPCGLCVWSTGLASHPLVEGITELRKDDKTRSLAVNDRLEPLDAATGKPLPEVLALGDCAQIVGEPLPATAQVASQQAKYAVRKLNALARERALDEPFRFNYQGSLAYIGGWRAIYDRSNAEKGTHARESGRLAWMCVGSRFGSRDDLR
jgi:NADH dehydrogenase FAD-containing subunit